MVKWSDIDDSGTSNGVKWSDIEPDQGGGFASGTLARMKEYEGLSPEQASSKFISGQEVTLKGIGDVLTERDPQKRIAALKSFVKPAYDVLTERDPAKRLASLKSVFTHYYQYPDEFATDVAMMAVPVEAGAAKAARGADEALMGSEKALTGRLGSVPETPVVPTEAERTASIKTKAGAGIQAAKDTAPPIPASEAQGLLDQIKDDTASEYNKHSHTAAKGWFKKFNDILPKAAAEEETDPLRAMTAKMPISGPARASLEKKLAEMPVEETEEPTVTLKDIHDLRQHLNDVHNHAYSQGYEQEGMVASKAKQAIDEFIVDKMGEGEWPTDMRNYALASTAEEIRNLTYRALYRRSNLSAGQRAAALNTELRQFARPTLKGENARMKMLRKLSPSAGKQMETLATAGLPNSTLLKIVGTAAPTGVMPVALSEVAGHLFNTILGTHLSPLVLMGMGAAAKHMAGARIERGIEGVIKTLNDAAEMQPQLDKAKKLVSPPVFERLMSKPATAQAIREWANASGARKKTAALVLATSIARELNTPTLVPRIRDEINNLDAQQ